MNPESVCRYYPLQEVFENAKHQINLTYGLELSLIEWAELRAYVRLVLTSLGKIEGKVCDYDFDPVAEIITRFMMDYYGLPFDFAFSHTSIRGSVVPFMDDWSNFKEYLKLQQEQMHRS